MGREDIRRSRGRCRPVGRFGRAAREARETSRAAGSVGRLADAAYSDFVLAKIPARRFGAPEDCVGAALLLCSEAGRYITGQSLYVDGGMSLL